MMKTHTQSVLLLAAMGLGLLPFSAQAEIDGYGPDAWRVTGVASNDTLNVRMGPGTGYPVIETFAHDERQLQQITCVPFYTMAHFSAMTEAQLDSLPAPWCLMRSADLSKAGWVAQRFIMPDYEESYDEPEEVIDIMKMLPAPTAGAYALPSDDLIEYARNFVAALYEYSDLAAGRSYLDPIARDVFFSTDFANALETRPPGADLLIDAQDFQGSISPPRPDPEGAMFRGMITINVDYVNFGQEKTAVFRLRGDTTRPDAPLRIFRIEHEGWSYP